MATKFFFCRHGIFDIDTKTLSNEGVLEIEVVKRRLVHLGFTPKKIWSARSVPCVQTAKLLAPKMQIQNASVLDCFGKFIDLKKRAKECIAPILEDGVPVDTLVVCNDTLPGVLAWRMLKQNGGTLDCIRKTFANPIKYASGYLVEETKLTYVSPVRVPA